MLEWVHVESLSPLRRMEYARDRLVSDFLTQENWFGPVKAWLFMTYVAVQELSISPNTWSKAKWVLWATTVLWLLIMGVYTILFAMDNPTNTTYKVLLRCVFAEVLLCCYRFFVFVSGISNDMSTCAQCHA